MDLIPGPLKDITLRSAVGGAQPTRRAVSSVGHWITGSEIAHKLDKERAEDAGNGAATIKVATKVDAVSVGQERGTARTTAETGAMGAGTTIVVVKDPTATREGMPNVSDLHHHLLELLHLLSRSRRLTVPVQTRAESMQSQWRLALLRASSVKRRSRHLMGRCTQNTRSLMAILNGTIGERA